MKIPGFSFDRKAQELRKFESFKKQIVQICFQTIFNLRKSGEIGAKYIEHIADEQKQKRS